MPVRSVTLNASKAGMTRLRDKGGASPETLYELTNAYINASRSPTQRPGTTWTYQFGANTAGLVAFQGVFYAFTADPTKIVSTGSYQVVLLRHPQGTSFSGQLSKIHYAQPFMGYLYVVAQFTDGLIRHYWLQNPPAWAQHTIYQANTMVQPTTPNGFYYVAIQTNNPPAWQPNMSVTGSPPMVVQPTVYNGYEYTVSTYTGTAATTGPTEPTWPTSQGATVTEYSTGYKNPIPAQPPVPPNANPPGTGTGGRYGNPGGRKAGNFEQP